MSSVFRELPRCALTYVSAIHNDPSAGTVIHSAQHIENCSLSGSARPDDHGKFALFDGKVRPVYGLDLHFSHLIYLRDIFK